MCVSSRFLLGRDKIPLVFALPSLTAQMVSTRSNGVRSVQTSSTTTSATPSTAVSPLLSNNHSMAPETPDTSDIDRDPKVMKTETRLPATGFVNTRKRLAEDELEDYDGGGGRLAAKRRTIQKAVYVEIPIKGTVPNSKVRMMFVFPLIMLSAFNMQRETPAKGKGRAIASKSNNEDLHLISEVELDYDEHLEESEPSDSEFEPDSDASLNRELSVIDGSESDEDIILAATIELSRETAWLAAQDDSGVGSSSRTITLPSGKITKKALAVERRLKRTGDNAKDNGKARATDNDDRDFILVDFESELSALSSSEDEVPLSKGKGKAAKSSCKDPEYDSWAERARRRRERAFERRTSKKEELALMRELGRRLTWVCRPFTPQT